MIQQIFMQGWVVGFFSGSGYVGLIWGLFALARKWNAR
jgi:hypothetical protein